MVTFGHIAKFWVVVTVIYLTAHIVPGFSAALLSSVLLALFFTIITTLVETAAGQRFSPRARRAASLGIAALSLWAAGRLVPGVHTTWWGALLAGGLLWLTGLIFPSVWG